MGFAPRFNAQRYLICDADAVTFERHNFFRMIREYANILEPQINQNLRSNPAFVLHHALPRRFTIELPARVHMNLWQRSWLCGLLDAKPAPGVM